MGNRRPRIVAITPNAPVAKGWKSARSPVCSGQPMAISRSVLARAAFVLAALLQLGATPVFAQQVPLDVGSTVNGFQDDFDGASLASLWMVRGQNVFSVS